MRVILASAEGTRGRQGRTARQGRRRGGHGAPGFEAWAPPRWSSVVVGRHCASSARSSEKARRAGAEETGSRPLSPAEALLSWVSSATHASLRPRPLRLLADRGPARLTWPDGARVALDRAQHRVLRAAPAGEPVRPPWPRGQPDVLGYSSATTGTGWGSGGSSRCWIATGCGGLSHSTWPSCEHHPEIIEACRVRGWEFFSHGIYNTRYLYGMDEARGAGHRRRRPDGLAAHGPAHRGWLSPALPPSARPSSSPSAASSTRATSSTTTSRSR